MKSGTRRNRDAAAGISRSMALALLGSALLVSQVTSPVQLVNPRVSRGGSFSIDIPDGPASANTKSVALARGNRSLVLKADYTPPVAPLKNGVARAQVPDWLPLGDYNFLVHLDQRDYAGSSALSVGPPGNPQVHLSEFSPPNTYDITTVYQPDANHWKAEAVDLVSLDFQDPNIDGRPLLLNGIPFDPVLSTCNSLPPLGSQTSPTAWPQPIYEEIVGTGHIQLCRVPKDSIVTVQGLSAVHPTQVGQSEQQWIRKSTEGQKASAVSLTLHGSDFQYDHPYDNVVWINHVRVPVIWDSCATLPSAGTSTSPVTPQVHGEVISTQEMHLCMVPVPADGQLLVAAGYGDASSETRAYRVFNESEWPVAIEAGIVALLLALLPLGLLSFVKQKYAVADESYKFRMLFLDQETDTYSLSKLQFYLWTVAAIFGYTYLFVSRVGVQFQAWPDVPGTLPAIIAVAAGTAVGSQVITATKGAKGAGDEKPGFADLITSGGVVAPDRLQMLLWTLLGVGAFFVATLQQGPGTISDLPAVPERLLYLMGLSSLGYLGGKMARKAGPIIDEISLTPEDSDEAILKSRNAASQLPDFAAPIADAQTRMQTPKVTGNAQTKAAIDSFCNAIKSAGAAMTSTDLTKLVGDLGNFRQTAEQAADVVAEDFIAGKATQADAETAQQAAAALQDFSADIVQALAAAAAQQMPAVVGGLQQPRTIAIRGSNLATDATFELNDADLPFRMLFNKDGKNAPEVVLRDDTTPTFASVLRLTIDPAKLGDADLAQFRTWFGADGKLTFTITNPDGQHAVISFTVPPGAGQKSGTA